MLRRAPNTAAPHHGHLPIQRAQNRQVVGAITDLVRTVEPGALYIHHEDTGHYKSNVEHWKTRDPGCKGRWPNDDFAAIDGGAGALAYRYGQIVESVQRVRNPDTGYDAARDCTIILISPPMGSIPGGPAWRTSTPTKISTGKRPSNTGPTQYRFCRRRKMSRSAFERFFPGRER